MQQEIQTLPSTKPILFECLVLIVAFTGYAARPQFYSMSGERNGITSQRRAPE
jgi:hypothetical protein